MYGRHDITLADGEIVGGKFKRPLPAGKDRYEKYMNVDEPQLWNPKEYQRIDMAEEQWKRDNAPELTNTLNQILGTQTGFTQNKFSGKELEMLANINLLLGKEKQLTPEIINNATYMGNYGKRGEREGDYTNQQNILDDLLEVIYANQRRDYVLRNQRGEDLIDDQKYFDSQEPISKNRATDYPNFNYFFGGR
jgi:hypothetical protein